MGSGAGSGADSGGCQSHATGADEAGWLGSDSVLRLVFCSRATASLVPVFAEGGEGGVKVSTDLE